MIFYRKRPIEVEAIQWTGSARCLRLLKRVWDPQFEASFVTFWTNSGAIEIKTLEGNVIANPGSYIIRGVKGEFYPCREDIFNKTYERVEA